MLFKLIVVVAIFAALVAAVHAVFKVGDGQFAGGGTGPTTVGEPTSGEQSAS